MLEKFSGEEQPVVTSKSTSTPAVNETQREVSKIAFSLKCMQNSCKVKRFKVVPVEVWGNNPEKSAYAYAFMDDGSDTKSLGLTQKLGLMNSNSSCKGLLLI